MPDVLRGTGRTTRLIAKAKQLMKEGKTVIVVVATKQHVDELAIKHNIKALHCSHPDFDWTQMRLRGISTPSIYLIDHHAIEKKFSILVHKLREFDE
jgi:PIN domain nuclease of toxin-antitoxin system